MSKTIHAIQNEDGTYRVVIKTDYPEKEEYKGKKKYNTKSELESVIEKADVYIVAYAEKNENKILSFTIKE